MILCFFEDKMFGSVCLSDSWSVLMCPLRPIWQHSEHSFISYHQASVCFMCIRSRHQNNGMILCFFEDKMFGSVCLSDSWSVLMCPLRPIWQHSEHSFISYHQASQTRDLHSKNKSLNKYRKLPSNKFCREMNADDDREAGSL